MSMEWVGGREEWLGEKGEEALSNPWPLGVLIGNPQARHYLVPVRGGVLRVYAGPGGGWVEGKVGGWRRLGHR